MDCLEACCEVGVEFWIFGKPIYSKIGLLTMGVVWCKRLD